MLTFTKEEIHTDYSPSFLLDYIFVKTLTINQIEFFNAFISPGPPSPPKDLVYTLKQSTLILEWAAPSDTGGRADLTYSIGCRRCIGRQCEPCGASVGFVPQQVGLTERTVTVVNLLPNTNYTFSVEALNGVSELLPNKRFYTQVNVSTSLPGESESEKKRIHCKSSHTRQLYFLNDSKSSHVRNNSLQKMCSKCAQMRRNSTRKSL